MKRINEYFLDRTEGFDDYSHALKDEIVLQITYISGYHFMHQYLMIYSIIHSF